MRKHTFASSPVSKRVTHLDPVVCSEWTGFRPGGRLFAVVPHGAQISVGLTNGIADRAAGGAVKAGLTTASYLRQSVAVAVPIYPSHRLCQERKCCGSRCWVVSEYIYYKGVP